LDTRSKYINKTTVVGVAGHPAVDGDRTDSDDPFKTARGLCPGIGATITSYKEFIHRQVWEVLGNDVPAQTTCTPEATSYKRSGDVGKINQEPILGEQPHPRCTSFADVPYW